LTIYAEEKKVREDSADMGGALWRNKKPKPLWIFTVKNTSCEGMLARYIDKKMKNIAARQPELPVSKIAVLAALNVADELSKLQEDYDALVKMMDSEKKDEKKNQKKQASR